MCMLTGVCYTMVEVISSILLCKCVYVCVCVCANLLRGPGPLGMLSYLIRGVCEAQRKSDSCLQLQRFVQVFQALTTVLV